ncbi:MAG: META domain-containing protein [Chloroflexota bacterium]
MENQQNKSDDFNEMEQETQGQSSTLVIVLVVALVAALAAIIFLLVVYVFGRGSGSDGEVVLPPPGVTVEATVLPPTPEPGKPTATVIARDGVNVRTGPGIEYTIIGIAPFGTTLEVVGVSRDSTWWVVNLPGAPNNYGWVTDEFVQVQNGEDVLVIPAPPTPTPAVTPTATATPAPNITFTASRTTINAGESATLSWSVENVTAVYLYPVGDRFENYPVVGQGSRDVQPYITTSYELLTFNPDGSSSASRIEITVVSGLTSGRWLLRSYSTSAGGLQTPLAGTEITARFGADGSLSGSAGCNSYNGTFIAYDQRLRVNTLTSSQALCSTPEGIMEQEGVFLSLMQQASRMAVSAGQLSIFDSGGNRILEFVSG